MVTDPTPCAFREPIRLILKCAAALLLGVHILPASEPVNLPSIYSYRAMDIDTLRAGFASAPREAGPWVFWMFFENVMSKEEITRELEEMAAAGFAGAELRFLSMHGFSGLPGPMFDSDGWSRLGQQRLEFLAPEFVDILEHTCAEAQRLGLRLAINLGMGWPPGGPWITDEYRSKHLATRSAIVQGPQSQSGTPAMSVPPDALVCAWRLRDDSPENKDVVVDSYRDLRSRVNAENSLEWDVPEGRWLIGVFHSVPGGLCDKGNGPEVDPGSRAAVLFHLDHLFHRLQPGLGPYFGSTLVEVTSDSWEYERRGDARYWSPSLWTAFPELTGYDLRPRLYALLNHGPDRDRTLADLERVEREVVRRNFFDTVTDYLHARGLRHRCQVRGRGLARDIFEAYAHADTPEIEEEVFLPEAVWVAHTSGKPIISAEAFTFLSGHTRNLAREGQQQLHEGPLFDPQRQWETNLAMLRAHAGAHFARGVNRIQMHGFSYSPPGVPPPGWRIYAEVHLNRNVPWWPYVGEFSRFVTRHQWVLQAGDPVADALVYPVRSNPTEGSYNVATDQPVAAINAIDAASPYTLALLTDRAGETPYACARVVLLEDVRELQEASQLLTLVQTGACLVCCRTLPKEWTALATPGDPAADVARVQAGFRDAHEHGKIVDARAQGWSAALAEAQSVHWTPTSAQLSFQHRRVEGGEIYFVTNWGAAFAGEVTFPHTDLTPEIWDADAGTTLPAAQYRIERGHTAVSLAMGPHESALVVFTHARPPLHVVHCDGGRVVRDISGGLRVRIDRAGPCRVGLSDGTARELDVPLPQPLRVVGPWTLRADPGRGVGLDAPVTVTLDQLVSWREIPALRTYAGIVSYHTEFELPVAFQRADLEWVLDLGEVLELADVWLNGQRIATSWFPPHRLDIAQQVKPGKNLLRVDVPNILKNHLERGDYTRPSGLLGPVRIRPVGNVDLGE